MNTGAAKRPVGPAFRGWPRWFGVLLLTVLLIENVHNMPGLGRHDVHLAITLALVAAVLGTSGLFVGRLTPFPLPVHLVLFALALGGSAVIMWLSPDGPGVLDGFAAVSLATISVPKRLGIALVIVAAVTLAAAGLVGGHRSLTGVLTNGLAVASLYSLVMVLRGLRERNRENERLLVELRESRAAQLHAAALAERARLAREMHDVLAHSLSGLMLQLEGARLLAVRDPADPRLAGTIERAHHLAHAGLDEARRAIAMLRDDDLPGPERLPELTAEFERDTGVRCALTVTDAEPGDELPSETRLALYRVTQEALTNIRKHAAPDRVAVTLAYTSEATSLTVTDTRTGGQLGPPVANTDGGGYGLTGMRERAELLGGTLTTEATPTGFQVTLWIPR